MRAGIAVDQRPATGVNRARPLAYDIAFLPVNQLLLPYRRMFLLTCGINKHATDTPATTSPENLQCHVSAHFQIQSVKLTKTNCILVTNPSPVRNILIFA